MSELIKMPNIGTKLAAQLKSVGIETIEKLEKAGSREAWLRMLTQDPSATQPPLRPGRSGPWRTAPGFRPRNKRNTEGILQRKQKEMS